MSGYFGALSDPLVNISPQKSGKIYDQEESLDNDIYLANVSHPYGVLPSGNGYFASNNLRLVRFFGLGPLLSRLTDELVSDILSYLSGRDLARKVTVLSRTCYVHGHFSDLWRDCFLREYPTFNEASQDGGIEFRKTWKDTYVYFAATGAGDMLNAKCNKNLCMSPRGLASGSVGDVGVKKHKHVPTEHMPIKVAGVYSNFLYRPFSCASFDFATACPGFFSHSDIDVVDAAHFTPAQFVEEYERRNVPVVIRGIAQSNPSAYDAFHKWNSKYLSEEFKNTSGGNGAPAALLRATSASAPSAAQFSMEQYFRYAAQTRYEEAPLYLFERNYVQMCPALLQDYEVPHYFTHEHKPSPVSLSAHDSAITDCAIADAGINVESTTLRDGEACSHNSNGSCSRISNSSNQLTDMDKSGSSSDIDSDREMDEWYATDLFRVLGHLQRPDFRWLVAGPARSGSIFHIDPNQTNAWNMCIRGRKKWIFYPPAGIADNEDENGQEEEDEEEECADMEDEEALLPPNMKAAQPPPGVECSRDGADVVVPISTGEWLLTFWKHHLKRRKHKNPKRRPLEIILNPGDVIFVPHGYWHMVVNLDAENIALTHNYVSTSNLSHVLRFLREKRDQISGVRDRKSAPTDGTTTVAAAVAAPAAGGDAMTAGAIQSEHLYEEFLQRLIQVLPPHIVDKFVERSKRLSTTVTGNTNNGRSAGSSRARDWSRTTPHKGKGKSKGKSKGAGKGTLCPRSGTATTTTCASSSTRETSSGGSIMSAAATVAVAVAEEQSKSQSFSFGFSL